MRASQGGEVLELVAAGSTNRESAAKLFISEATVKSHLLNIYAKLGPEQISPEQIGCEQTCWQQKTWGRVLPVGQGGDMSDENKVLLFNEQSRQQLFRQRVVVLDGQLNDDNGTLLATQILTLAAEDSTTDIALWIHSIGGSVPSMLAIRDVMRLVPCDVSTLVLGLACSAGQFLLSAGTPGKRFALPHARVLMHQGSAGIGGSAVEIEIQANDLRHIRDTVLGLIAQDTGQPRSTVFEDSLHDHWYTAEQALEYGFIDHVVSSFDQVMPLRRHQAEEQVAATKAGAA